MPQGSCEVWSEETGWREGPLSLRGEWPMHTLGGEISHFFLGSAGCPSICAWRCLQPGGQVPSKGCCQIDFSWRGPPAPPRGALCRGPLSPQEPVHRLGHVDTAVTSAGCPCTAGHVTSSSRWLVFRKYNCCLENVVVQIDWYCTQVSSKGGVPWIIFMQHLHNSSEGPNAFLSLTS